MISKEKLTRKLALAFDESGAAATTFAITLTVLCGFVALAADMGHIVMAKAELQRTADAAALAGAMGLTPYTGPVNNQIPNWPQGQNRAHALISNAANEADNQVFSSTEGTVDYGYWLLKPPSGTQQTLPKDRTTLVSTSEPEPAVSVTLSRNVNLSFAPLVGISSPRTVTARATAIILEAYKVLNPAPIAVSYDTVTNLVNQQVVIDYSEQGVKVNSNNDEAGWYNQTGLNDVGAIQDQPLEAGATQIYLMPGAMNVALHDIGNTTIVLPVVQNVTQKVWQTIIGWAAFKIDSTTGPVMTGHFVGAYFDPNVMPSSGNGSNQFGVMSTPKLVN